MWCTKHSAHVSSTYSLISAIAGVGVATVGAAQVEWGWSEGRGLGAIFAGLGMAPIISAGFAATIFMLIKVVVHMRRNPVPWAVYTAPFFFLIAGTVCTLSIVYKGSPKLGLNKKPPGYVAGVTMGTGGALCLLSALFFVPFVYARVVQKDQTIRWWNFVSGPALLFRPPPQTGDKARVPNYAVVQEDKLNDEASTHSKSDPAASPDENEKQLASVEVKELTYKEQVQAAEERLRNKLLQRRGESPPDFVRSTSICHPLLVSIPH